MKNYNMILTEKLQKYQLYRQVKLINMKQLNSKQLNKLNLLIFHWEKLLKKNKTNEDQGKKRIDAL